MTRNFTLFFLSLISYSFFSCTKSTCGCADLNGNWVMRADFDGMVRRQAIAFTVGDTAYIGTGVNGTNYMNDLWRYNASANNWAQRASMPSDGRAGAVAFTIGNKGYVGTGRNNSGNLKDLWEFDAATNQWKRKADFTGSARYAAVAFAINNKAYIATGFDGNDLGDVFEYNPAFDTTGSTQSPWQAKQDFPGVKRSGAVAFVYMNKAYLVTGGSNTGSGLSLATDMWMFDPSTEAWTKKRSIINESKDTYDDAYNIIRTNAVAFVMPGFSGINHAYIACGENGSILSTVWEYDFPSDLWVRKTDWEGGVGRTGASAFTVSGRGYVIGGNNLNYYFDDIREFFPNAPYNPRD